MEEMSYFLKDNSSELIRILIQMIIIWLNDIQRHKIGDKNYFFRNYSETLDKFNSRFPNLEINDTVVKLDYLGSLIKNNINLNLIASNIIFELSALTDKKMRLDKN
jgi:hypothetical protein